MNKILSLLAVLGLSACDVPVSAPSVSEPSGAITVAQLLAETEGRPFECVNYDSATDSCTTLSRFQVLAPNTYRMVSQQRVDEDVPALEFSVTMRAQGRTLCADFSDISIRSTRGEEGIVIEAAFAQIEIEMKQSERFCGSYIPNGNGYIFRILSGPPEALEDPNQDIRFFASPKRLRLED